MQVIHELRANRQERRLEWVPLTEISPALRSAILCAEDRRFYEHGGVDWSAVGAALLATFRSTTPRGASTITMQVAAQLDAELRPRQLHRSLWQKWKQIRAAGALEHHWSKPEILEAYLNLVTFRGELQGIAAAAQGLFGKKPHGLDEIESLALAALVRSPNAGVDQVASRALALSQAVNPHADRAEIVSRITEALSRPYFIAPAADLAPHVALQLLGSGANHLQRRITSTLDGRLQRFAAEALRRHILSVSAQNVHDGAFLAVDNRTGDVLAYLGNIGDRASARYVDGVRARRQAGSTLKPFVYGRAFEQRLLTPASLIEDSPVDLPVLGGIYRPSNYDRQFHGMVTARVALASSLNVPAVKTLGVVGVESLVSELERFGFRNLRAPDFYGPSLALGAADVTLWDLVNAYRALSNGGVWSGLRLKADEPTETPRRVMSSKAAFLLADILSDRESRSRTFSLESPLSTRFWTAVKTGTSTDMRDNWCVGFSDSYTVGVWAGNFSGEPMWNVSGITGAAPVWVEILNWLHRDRPSIAPAPPAGIVARSVDFSGSGRMRREWFIQGTETSAVEEAPAEANCRIVYPASGTVIALDPDIPADQQKLFFEAHPRGAGMKWALNGKILGPATSVCLWEPSQGQYTLSLLDEQERVLDSVAFEVRGNR